jgi:hypothetical protein
MKKITIAFLLLSSSLGFSQTITQSSSQAIENNSTISCQLGGTIFDNTYYRAFDLSSFNITEDFVISAVEFGVEVVNTSSGSYPITVRLYTTTDVFPANFPGDDYTLLAEQTYDVPNQAQSIYSAAMAATVPLGSNLVVEIGYEGDPTGDALVYLGSNDNGETAPTYIVAPNCGVSSPETIQQVNNDFAGHGLVLNIVGPTVLGVKQNALSTVSIYPNPTTAIVNFRLPNGVEVQKAYLSDITGKQIGLEVQNNSVNISRFSTGIYMLTLQTMEGNVTKKIVKE